MRFRRVLGRSILRICLMLAVFFLLIWPALGLLWGGFFPFPITPLQIQRSVMDDADRWREWVSHDQIPDDLRRALIASEDARYCDHHGFDWVEIQNAWKDYRVGRRLRGASTISMQTARSAFLWGGRDPIRKGLEVWYTPWLELIWGKQRILDVYLNTVEWGPGVYGAEAASKYFFGIPAKDLSRSQAARLVAILPNPRSWSASSSQGYVAGRASTIQARMQSVPYARGVVCP